ncbi:hybrid non-ribosomal peptide synthetase/type I polyketide synthase [Paucisalibacillus globulus]|uniref:hybrid non-ribosomal peptide synthetase/type I polyketide synthase n=1 Tax=Paucisalibacillus globulus TaxID=351095 RepID=UPI000402036B|nr:hybrid non-ribosomal peptide synthetase/type I polyketide synthase [Paucisalibacillus globulus]
MEEQVIKYKTALKKAAEKIENLSQEINKQKNKEPIAVIGYSCRFPGEASNPEGFWKVLENGLDTVTKIREDRFDYKQYYSNNPEEEGKMVTSYGSFLKGDIKAFDNSHFGLTAIEASSIDPQHRLLLEVSWEAMENSAINMDEIKGSRTGVFIGINSYEYANAELFSGNTSDITPYSTTGVSLSSAAGRLAYFYDFTGPAITSDTACSSTITALNAAVESLQNHQCDMAIVGGANLLLSPESFIGLSKYSGLSKDGRCKPFDETADGFGRGEGCGVIILKRLEDAKMASDDVKAIVKSVALGQDGKSNGYTAPNGISQQRVISQALTNAGLAAEDIDYIETHGAGTPLGDLIEVQAISEVFKNKKDKLLIGSVKSNLGHLEAASGMASLIKVIMAMEKKKIPASIQFHNPNPNINWDKTQVVHQLMEWPQNGKVRRAGISSFGFSGSLAHAILEEPPTIRREENRSMLPVQLMTLSAKNETALRDYLSVIKEFIKDKDEKSIRDIAYSTNISRSFLNYRFSIVGKSREELVDKIEKALTSEQGTIANKVKKSNHKIAFLFTGQGSIYKEIAKDLYLSSDPFRKALDVCNEEFNNILSISIIEAIYGEDPQWMNSPLYSQPIIFSIEYALTKWWDTLGVKPYAVIGHSIGEYTAACYAGLISLKDAIKMIAQRGKMMDSIDIDGKMLGILTNEENVKHAIEESGCKHVSIAAINAPENVTISGPSQEVDRVVRAIQEKHRVFINKLDIPHPYHSKLMTKYEGVYHNEIGEIKFSHPHVTMISTITGKVENIETLGNKKYWVEHLSKCVNFQESIHQARKLGVDTFIEIGGDATLSGLAHQSIKDKEVDFLPSLRKGLADYNQLFASVSKLYVKGFDFDWTTFHSFYQNRSVIIPNYPFQRKKLWREVNHMKNNSNPREEQLVSNKTTVEHPEQDKGNQLDKIKLEIKEMIRVLTWLELDEIEDDLNLFMLGFDSLVLVSLNKQIDSKYHVNISLNDFFTNLDTVEKIASYIVDHADISLTDCSMEVPNLEITETSEEVIPEVVTGIMEGDHQKEYRNANSSGDSVALHTIGPIQDIFNKQIQIMDGQLEIIKNMTETVKLEQVNNSNVQVEQVKQKTPKTLNSHKQMVRDDTTFVPYKKMSLKEVRIDSLKQSYIKNVEEKYVRYFLKSKENTQHYRNVYANNRNVAGFRPLFKEMIYQIVAEKGNGSKIEDIDGNSLLDLTMGFGVSLFGHNPSFVNEALKEELNHGMPLGPMGRLAGNVAELISELTGVERVAFYNSGTEANMVAVRIARAITGKKKIVVFAGSYHGTYDGLLGLPSYEADGTPNSIPLAPGILDSMVRDLVILPYDDENALDYIKNNANDIAGVLVETVQSRKPDVQPHEFLLDLRKITEQRDIALIFDEIITGFRIRAGGAQEYFDIQADIVTYGKVIGGGMPIGVVSGKAKYLDSIDGGMWQFGDDSVPPSEKKRTFVAGTFSHHPMAMAAATATLNHIKENQNHLYTTLNEKTDRFVTRINTYFQQNEIPMKVVHFGSLFRFVFQGDFEIFFYGLLEKGIYVWEGRNCFISTEHSEKDIESIISAIIRTVEEMREAGYFGIVPTPPSNKIESSMSTPNETIQSQVLPMSTVQQRLYAQSLVSEGDPNTIVSVLTYKGELDIPTLNQAISAILQRHESLRTQFYVEDGDFKQEIIPQVDFKIEKVTRKNEPLDDLIQATMKPFDLGKAPLFNVSVIENGDDTGLLIFHFHHTIADGISMNIFVQELIQQFEGQSLAPITSQYRDFTRWEQNYLRSEKMEQDKGYWLDKLSGNVHALQLPTDFPASKEASFLAATVHDKVEHDLVNRLKVTAGKHQCSVFMLLVAAFNLLLKKLSGNEDILIGTPATTRAAGPFDTTIGMFTNTIVLKNLLSDNKTLKECIAEVKQSCLEAYSHLYYPYQDLVSDINSEKSNHTSLINTMFIYEKTDQRSLKIKDLEIGAHDFKNQFSDVDLTLEILEENGAFDISLTYKTDLFKEETIKRWSQYFKNILAVIQQEGTDEMKLGDIEIVDFVEKDKLLYEFNNKIEQFKVETKTVVQWFEEQAEKTPNQTAIVFENNRMSYRELNEKANQLARLLQEKGVRPETIVGIMVDRSFDMLVGILSVLKAGGAYLPIDADYPEERIRYMLMDSGCNIMLTEKTLQEKYASSIQHICMDVENVTSREKENLEVDISPQHLAYVIYTSGSTGKPKGVMIEHRNLASFVKAVTDKVAFNVSDRVLCLTTFSFDIFGLELFVPITKGMQIYLLNNREQNDLLHLKEIIYRNEINVLQVTPSRLKLLIDSIRNDDNGGNYLQSVRTVCIGGEELPYKVFDDLRKLSNAKIYNMYGPTEATIWATVKELINGESITIGKPLSNCRVLILNDKKSLLPIGVPGELYISGEAVGRGYIHKDELTLQNFEGNPLIPGECMYRTGDLARWTSDGTIQFLGRKDNQVKIRGHRIELGEIESQLVKDPRINEAVVVDRKVGEEAILCAYVIFNEKMLLPELRSLISRALPDYMMPAHFIPIEKLPYTLNGKVDKLSLPEPTDELETGVVSEAPNTKTEELLFDTWMKVLRTKRAGINDDFFSLGGDSIKAVQLVSRLRSIGIHLEVEQVYEYPTVKQLAEVVANQVNNQEMITGKVVLTPFQQTFFDEGHHKSTASCQSVILFKEDGIQTDVLKKVFDNMMIHHDALRMMYKSFGDNVLQLNRGMEGNLYEWNVFTSVSYEEMLDKCSEIRGNMELFSGPLVKIGVFKTTLGDYLFLAIHHLLMDATSWNILMEDLERGYTQATKGEEIKFLAKTTSYKEWSNKLHDYADSHYITKQLEHWNDMGAIGIKPLPRNGKGSLQ